jgi:DNA topoisomerase-1
MLIISSKKYPKKPGETDIDFWIDDLQEPEANSTKQIGLSTIFKHLQGQHDQQTHAGHMVSGTRENLPDHIKALKIPPAWTDLMYNEELTADLLVTGKDKKGREKYIYSERFVAQQAAEKFERIKELTAKYGSIHEQNETNAKSNDPKIKEKAECLDLIMETGIRPGSETDTGAEKQAYGATTLLGKHVKIAEDGSVSLQFVGKKGVDLDIPVQDSHLKAVLVKRAKFAGENGKLFDVDDDSLRDYTHTLDGGNFKPKDFRTRLATETAVDEVKKFGKTMPTNMKEYKKMVKAVATVVSKKLGNTPVVALQSYIVPSVFAAWRAAFTLKKA